MLWLVTFPVRHIKLIAVCGLVALFWTGVAKAAERDLDAEAFIQSISDTTYDVLNNDEITLEERKAGFRSIVISSMDFNRIGLFTLANYRRRVDQAELAEFLDAFDDYAIGIYEARLGDYAGEKIKVVGSLIRKKSDKGNDIIVESSISFVDGSNPLPVNWRVIEKDGVYQVIDIQVIGVWMALEQRAQFTSIMSRHNGDIESLINHLRGTPA